MRLAPPLSCLGILGIALWLAVALYREMEQYGLPVRADITSGGRLHLGGAYWCTNAAPHTIRRVSALRQVTLHWKNTTRNGDVVDDRGYIDPIRNGDAFDTTGYT